MRPEVDGDGVHPVMEPKSTALVEEGRRVLLAEARAVEEVANRMGPEFAEAVELLDRVVGRVVVTGVGKSGIIGRKIASTLTSTGTPASFLHPVDGLHGDLGFVSRSDAAIFISKSGGTSELHGLMEYMIRLGLPRIAITGGRDSSLARHSTVVLDSGVDEEACPMDLAPTSSTTTALAVGDALAMALLQKKGFQPSDFARYHPGGALGRRLTVRVEDVMVGEGYPSVEEAGTMRDCIVPLAHMRGTVPIVSPDRHVVGVVTAGDLTRLMNEVPDFLEVPVRGVMTRNPKLARLDQLGAAAVHEMEQHGIMALPVVNEEGTLQGMVHLHDLMKAGIV